MVEKDGVWQEEILLPNSNTYEYVGMHFKKGITKKDVFRAEIALPCGKHYTYTFFEFPEMDMICDCGNPNCWIVKYDVPPVKFVKPRKRKK